MPMTPAASSFWHNHACGTAPQRGAVHSPLLKEETIARLHHGCGPMCNDAQVAFVYKDASSGENPRLLFRGLWARMYGRTNSKSLDADETGDRVDSRSSVPRAAFVYDDPSMGETLRQLLRDSRFWVHRRVDSLRLDADGTTRRFVSLDITIPKTLKCRGSEARVVVPLGVLEKGTKQRFDASYDGKSIPVLGRKDNSLIVAELLLASLPSFLKDGIADGRKRKDLFIDITSCAPDESNNVLEKYFDWSESIVGDRELSSAQLEELEVFDALVEQMTKNFVLLVEVDEQVIGRRVVMKYAFDQDEPTAKYPGTSRIVIAQDVNDLGFASSHHVELEVPTGLSVQKLELIEIRGEGDNQDDQIARKDAKGRLAHVNINPSAPDAVGLLRAEIAVAKQGVFSFTIVTVWAVLIAILVATAIRIFDEFVIRGEPAIPSPAASILLIGPALLISWMSRTPEHPMLAGMLKPLRRMLTLAAFSLLIMAGLAAVQVQPWLWHVTWGVLIVSALLNLTLLAIFQLNIQLPRRQKFDFGDRL